MVVKKDDIIQLELPEKGDKLLSQELYVFQWDKGQKLEILNVPDGTEVQFGNDKVEATLNRIKTNGFVEIPDVMLTYAEPISAYVQHINEDSETTKIQIVIKVIERPRSGDYIYPEDEQSFREQMEAIMLETKNIAERAENKASDIEKRANDGEFNGKNYIITDKDYDNIAEITKNKVNKDFDKINNEIEKLLKNGKIIYIQRKELMLSSFCSDVEIGNIYFFEDVNLSLEDNQEYINGYVIPQIVSSSYGYHICYLLIEANKIVAETDKKIYRCIIEKEYYSDKIIFTKERIVTSNELTEFMHINNAYTKEQVNDLISAIKQFNVEKVDSLPYQGEALTLYLVPKQGENNDNYDEYIFLDGWEHIGTTAVDLSNYVPKSRKIANYSLNSDISSHSITSEIVKEIIKGSFDSSLVPWLMRYCASQTQQKKNTEDITEIKKDKFELVNEITLEEEVSAVSITKDFDNNDLKIVEFFVYAAVHGSTNNSSTGYFNIKPVDADGTVLTNAGSGIANLPVVANTSSAKYCYAEFKQIDYKNNKYIGLGTYNNGPNLYGSLNSSPFIFKLNSDYLKGVYIHSGYAGGSNVLGAGTKISLYARRYRGEHNEN